MSTHFDVSCPRLSSIGIVWATRNHKNNDEHLNEHNQSRDS
jgi:hypothetical protein